MSSLVTAGLLVGVLALAWCADHYHGKAEGWREQAHRYQQLSATQAATINDINQRQQRLAELDKTHTQKLTDAKNQIAALQHDVAAGRKQLQLNARCPAAGKSTSSGSVGNAAAPELTADARRDYWRLRSGITRITSQVNYLQDYIRQQCLPPQTTASH